jgi:pyruvate dehydrogenase E1 component
MDAMRDSDKTETQEWLDALAAVKEHRGIERANFIVSSVVEAAQRDRIYAAESLTTLLQYYWRGSTATATW